MQHPVQVSSYKIEANLQRGNLRNFNHIFSSFLYYQKEKFVHKIDWDIRIMDPYFQQQKTPEECKLNSYLGKAKFIDRFLSLENEVA